jgi:hypothetical protein
VNGRVVAHVGRSFSATTIDHAVSECVSEPVGLTLPGLTLLDYRFRMMSTEENHRTARVLILFAIDSLCLCCSVPCATPKVPG